MSLSMVLGLTACGGSKAPAGSDASTPAATGSTATPTKAASDYQVAMITDYGDITDQSFNQTTYEACKAFCEENNMNFNYFKPAGDSDAERVAMIEYAIDEGYNVIVMPGYAFARRHQGNCRHLHRHHLHRSGRQCC
ncbi:MAG: BMP family ABC transporter substrate-binding protein [Oscillospiraceae bacterium]